MICLAADQRISVFWELGPTSQREEFREPLRSSSFDQTRNDKQQNQNEHDFLTHCMQVPIYKVILP